MPALISSDLETMPADQVFWGQLFRYEDGEGGAFPTPSWQGEVRLVDEARWPGLRELHRLDGGLITYLDFRNGGRDVYMSQDGALTVSERHYGLFYRNEQDGNSDFAARKVEADRQYQELASALGAAVSEMIQAPLALTSAELARPGLDVLDQGHELWAIVTGRDLILAVSADVHDPARFLVRRQSSTGEPLSWLEAPETWVEDTPVASLSRPELDTLLDRLS